MSRPTLRGKLKANAVVLLRLINSPSTWKDSTTYPDHEHKIFLTSFAGVSSIPCSVRRL
jgi:hypothetical protein